MRVFKSTFLISLLLIIFQMACYTIWLKSVLRRTKRETVLLVNKRNTVQQKIKTFCPETTTEVVTTISPTTAQSCKKKFRYLTQPTEPKHHDTIDETRCLEMKESSTISLVNFVVSSAPNFLARQIIRETSGSISFVNGLSIKHVFVVGKSTEENTNLKIIKESEEHGDVLFYDYPDNYLNLVYKTLALLQWASENLSTQIIISKTDDDVAVDFFQLSRNLEAILDEVVPNVTASTDAHEKHKNIFENFPVLCGVSYKTEEGPLRDKNNKNYVSIEEYAASTYPTYCGGPMYVMPVTIASRLYELTCDHEMLKNEDVWFTGVIRERIGRGDSNIVRRKYSFAQHYQTSETSFEHREQAIRNAYKSMIDGLKHYEIPYC
ncbi:beta-1,3-galactosyltransferase 5-like [Ciona intestinalis]